MILIPHLKNLNIYYNSSIDDTNSNNFCYEIKICIRPFNDIGAAQVATNSKIYVTKNGKFFI